MKLPYVKVPSADLQKPWLLRPIIPIIILNQQISIRVDALIDSGADRCFFHYQIGTRFARALSPFGHPALSKT
jgi:hypothetical protein